MNILNLKKIQVIPKIEDLKNIMLDMVTSRGKGKTC